jgi:hypothetical protein
MWASYLLAVVEIISSGVHLTDNSTKVMSLPNMTMDWTQGKRKYYV